MLKWVDSAEIGITGKPLRMPHGNFELHKLMELVSVTKCRKLRCAEHTTKIQDNMIVSKFPFGNLANYIIIIVIVYCLFTDS